VVDTSDVATGRRNREVLVAWPAFYDASGVMTFIVNQDGIVYEKDPGPETATAVRTRGSIETCGGVSLGNDLRSSG
jgi:hypothetical protein